MPKTSLWRNEVAKEKSFSKPPIMIINCHVREFSDDRSLIGTSVRRHPYGRKMMSLCSNIPIGGREKQFRSNYDIVINGRIELEVGRSGSNSDSDQH